MAGEELSLAAACYPLSIPPPAARHSCSDCGRNCWPPIFPPVNHLIRVIMPHPREEPEFQLYVLLETVLGVDGRNFTENIQRFLAKWQPPAGQEWTAQDEERRQMFASMKPGEFFAIWRHLRTELRSGVYTGRG